MKRLMAIIMTVVTVLSGLSLAFTPTLVEASPTPITITCPDTTISGGYQAGNFPEVWDLTKGDLILTFTADLNGISDLSGAHAWTEFGIRAIGYGNFNPTWQVEGAGVWLATDYDWTPGTFAPDPVGQPKLDMDDKLILQRGGGCGEGGYGVSGTGYNLPAIPPAPGNNHRIWWDRDGVDPWQNPATANTGGIYNIVMTLHATSDTAGTAYMTINGLAQGFETDGNWNTIELTPAGMTFAGDMKQMQVFYGIYGYGATHSATFSEISVNGYQHVITVQADDQTKLCGTDDPELTYTCDTTGVTFTGTLGRDAGEDPGTYAINQGSLSAVGYAIDFVEGELSIFCINGPFAPLVKNGNGTGQFKAGSTIPVKFQLTDGMSLVTTATGTIVIGTDSAEFRWDNRAQQYVANVKTSKVTGTFDVVINVDGIGSKTLISITLR